MPLRPQPLQPQPHRDPGDVVGLGLCKTLLLETHRHISTHFLASNSSLMYGMMMPVERYTWHDIRHAARLRSCASAWVLEKTLCCSDLWPLNAAPCPRCEQCATRTVRAHVERLLDAVAVMDAADAHQPAFDQQ